MDDKIATGYSPSFIARIEKRNANLERPKKKTTIQARTGQQGSASFGGGRRRR